VQREAKNEFQVETISEEEVKKLLNASLLVRNEIENAQKDLRLRQDNVRQEFNIYKEKFGDRPYLEFSTERGLDTKGIMRDWVMLSSQAKLYGLWREDFRESVLKNLNAGSGFYFRYVGKGPCPPWVDEILLAEGWPPAIEGGR
jgi:hypothetical protein